ncbi:hypothetical protein HanPSC8_Chr01g0044431 [Helianthus annuus]|nr:hypothetical protein HanPSC8_Chr01g0044431 [Helianthus annuus]
MTNKRPELEDVRPCYSSDLEDTGNGKHEPPPSHKDANHPSLNYPLPPRPVVTGSMSHLNDDQENQNGKGEQNGHSSKNTFTPYQKTHIEQQIIDRIDYHFEGLRTEMSKMIEEQMQHVFKSLRESTKTRNGHKATGFLRKVLK